VSEAVDCAASNPTLKQISATKTLISFAENASPSILGFLCQAELQVFAASTHSAQLLAGWSRVSR
jgi:hypothetical protein